jgi:hypothetical protein
MGNFGIVIINDESEKKEYAKQPGIDGATDNVTLACFNSGVRNLASTLVMVSLILIY